RDWSSDVCSSDLFWEVTLIPIWLIAGLWGQENKRFEFTTKFFVYTFVGSLFMLAGFIYVYNYSASFALTDMYNADLNLTQQTVVFWFIFFARSEERRVGTDCDAMYT